MNYQTFRNILLQFADSPNDLTISHGKLLIQVRDELIEALLVEREGNVLVNENDQVSHAEKWIVNRIAKLPILADRILSYIPKEEYFVDVSGKFLDDIAAVPDEKIKDVSSASGTILESLDAKLAGDTQILYITSEAGEGKTTLINQIARKQAELFKRKEAEWLLLPISLGGRPFIRFDDVVIGSLTNRLRFPFLYYDSVIELAKLGVLVLALDGFEEMFIESSSGDAISALSGLVQKIGPSARLLVAARKAYFEFKSLKTQSQLFDAIAKENVSFSRISINRWGKDQFIDYGVKRNIQNIDAIYEGLLDALKTADHPLLSRAVLIKRLLDIAETTKNTAELIRRITSGGENYFREFIDIIIEREAREKWIDKRGDISGPLLTKEEHYILLSFIAEEMWRSSTDSLPGPIIDMLGELACDALKKDVVISRQVTERIRDHALLKTSIAGRAEFQFDHEEFKWFFLADRIESYIASNKIEDTKALLRISALPDLAVEVIASTIKRRKAALDGVISFLEKTAQSEGPASFVKQNCGAIVIQMLNGAGNKPITIKELIFPSEVLYCKKLENITFNKCYFYTSSIHNTLLKNCNFDDCNIDRLEIDGTEIIENVTFYKSLPKNIYDNEFENAIFEPSNILLVLQKMGIQVKDDNDINKQYELIAEDQDLVATKKAIRAFLRSTQVNEDVFKIRLGNEYSSFTTNVVPLLIKFGILVEVPYRGGGRQRRFAMGVQMTTVEEACALSKGSFDKFLEICRKD